MGIFRDITGALTSQLAGLDTSTPGPVGAITRRQQVGGGNGLPTAGQEYLLGKDGSVDPLAAATWFGKK
jgi:hypothetical protein